MDPISQNIEGVQQLVGSKINKVNYDSSNPEGIDGDVEDLFTLKLDDYELLKLANLWTNQYRSYEAGMKLRQEANATYYLGKQKEGGSLAENGTPISANLLFEAEETFLPAALSKNPEPVVWSDNTPQGNDISTAIKTMLQYHADILVLRRKLSLMTRHWSIYFLGVMKHGWDHEIQDIKSEVVDPQNLIFDIEGYVDCYGDFIGYIGERITTTAERLIELNPTHKDYILSIVDDKLGTKVTYTQWWNDDYMFETFKEKVLFKGMNPHFNPVGLDGNPGNNHFAKPKKPYTFLSVFSLQKQPHDITSLIEQNIPNQRRISRRTEQIDYNLSRANNSDVFSENNFNQETAKQAANALIKGHPILVPSGGPIGEAIHRLQGNEVGSAFFNELENSKQDLRSIFGTQGITAQPPEQNETARGMILSNQYDNSRIGGGIGDAIEQVADNVFNWWVQLYHVYYDQPHFASILGGMKAVEYITLSLQDIQRKLVISVSPNSMKPKDEVSEMNQALSLYEAGVLDPKTLLTVLNFPDPNETAGQAVLWKLNPQLYMQLNFPDIAQIIQAQQAQQAQMQQQPGSPQQAPPPGSTAPPGGPVQGSPPPTTGGVPSNPSLSQVPLPPLPK